MPVSPFIDIKNLQKIYPKSSNPILKNISFSVAKGEICSIIGRSGAGKSTLLRCLNCLESFESGSIRIGDFFFEKSSFSEKKKLLKDIGTVFQSFNLLTRRTVIDNILLPAEWAGMGISKAREKAIKLAEKVGLGDKLHKFPEELSGGQRQRVAIARALMTDASLLLCDEFTSALDPETSLEILCLLRQLNQDMGITIILVTHDMAVVREVSDKVIVLEQGNVVEIGRVEEVLLQPQHSVTRILVRGLFIKQLPNDILNNLLPSAVSGQVLIQLVFSGTSARQPVITDLIQKHNICVNILSGSLDHLRETSLGVLTVSIPNESETINTTLAYLKKCQVASEILGYLPE